MAFGSFNVHDEFFGKHQLNYLADFVRVLGHTGLKFNFYDVLVTRASMSLAHASEVRLRFDSSVPASSSLALFSACAHFHRRHRQRRLVIRVEHVVELLKISLIDMVPGRERSA